MKIINAAEYQLQPLPWQSGNHRARATVEYLRQVFTPEFISPDLWPPNSPHLNPVDYRVWGCLQDWVYQKRVRDVDELKQHLVEDVWPHLS